MSLILNRTSVLMLMRGWEQREWSPCKSTPIFIICIILTKASLVRTYRSITTINTAKDDAAADDGDDDDKEEESYGTPLVTSMDLVEEELANMSVSDVVTTSSSSAVPTAMTSLISSADKSSRTKVTLSVLPMHTYRHHTGWSIRFIHRKMNPSVYCLMKQSDIAQAV